MNSIFSSGEKYRQVLGINRRNQEYIRPFNPPSAKRIADNKILTKRVLAKGGIKTPKIIKVIRTRQQLEFFDWDSLPKSFVVKPNRGTGGNGILVFYGKKKGELAWIKPNHQIMTKEQLKLHMEKILEGSFSMGESKDLIIIEERILNHSSLKKYSYRGVPDIRLIVFNKIPVMAMVRFPTKSSDGKANLHAGGICAGIDIASGLTTYAIQLRKKSFLEDTYVSLDYTSDFRENLPLRGIPIPFWDKILDISIKCQEICGLGYIGVDIAIDENQGPLVFELNARPGLGIQMANNSGLRPRLERVKGIKIKTHKRAIQLAKTLFGGEIEEEIETLSGKEIVNLIEKVTIFHKDYQSIKKKGKKNRTEIVKSMLDTGITTSRIDEGLAYRMGYDQAIKTFKALNIPDKFESFADAQKYIDQVEKTIQPESQIVRLAKIFEIDKIKIKPVINAKIKIRDESKDIEAVLSTQKDTIYPLLIGRKDLKNYLIDTSKTFIK